MGLFDQAKDLANQHEDKIDGAAEKAGEFASEKTGGKFDDQINQGVDFVQGQTGSNEDRPQQ